MLRKKVKEKEVFIIQLLEKISFLECEVRHYIIVIILWKPIKFEQVWSDVT